MQYKESFETDMRNIISAIKAAGYDPKIQLYGYLRSGDASYITRSRGAANRFSFSTKRNYVSSYKNGYRGNLYLKKDGPQREIIFS